MRFLLGIRKGENERKSIHCFLGEEERRGAKERQRRRALGEGLNQLEGCINGYHGHISEGMS